MLSISTYIGSTAAHRALASPLLVIRYLSNLVNTTMMMIMIHKIVIVLTSIKIWQVSVFWMAWVLLCRVPCSLLNGIFYSNIRYNFVLTIESSCLLHIYAQFYKVCFHWNLDRKQVLKPGGNFQPTYLSVWFFSIMMKPGRSVSPETLITKTYKVALLWIKQNK